MIEESVTKSVIFFLKQHEWEILDYDFPGSGTGRSFHIGTKEDLKKRKRVIPDIIAYKNKTILWVENKEKDTISDYKKIYSLFQESPNLIKQICHSYSDKPIDNLFFAISFSEKSRYLEKAAKYNVNCILQIISSFPEPEIKILFDQFAIFTATQ